MKLDNNDMDEKEINDIINMLDSYSENGVSRIKVTMDDTLKEGETKKEYHHGRCDVGSPWARGCSFDVLE